MGGILSAEVALLGPYSRVNSRTFRHRILGTISFDCPFLGVHPGVILSGIGSLFRSAPESSPGLAANDVSADSSSLSQVSSLEQGPPTPSDSSDSRISRPDPNAEISKNSSYGNTAPVTKIPTRDPNYNPPFPNDKRKPVRTNWDSAAHFIMKHSDGVTRAARSYITSHLEFGGCLADYKGLKNRYSNIRALEDSHSERVRFVNYYTLSTGRPKRPNASPQITSTSNLSQNEGSEEHISPELQNLNLSRRESRSLKRSPQQSRCESQSRSPPISVDEHLDGKVIPKIPLNPDESTFIASDQYSSKDTVPSTSPERAHLNKAPAMNEESENDELCFSKNEIVIDTASAPATLISGAPNTHFSLAVDPKAIQKPPFLPPLPPSPKEPPAINLGSYTDKDARELAQKQYGRQKKAYLQALKDYRKAIREREKLIEKRQKAAKKEIDRRAKAKEKESVQKLKMKEGNPASIEITPGSGDLSSDDHMATPSSAERPRPNRKFCLLPPKMDNQIDPCWVRILMRDVDEVGAHCGLFFIGEHYTSLVSDVGNRIKEWISQR